MVNISTMIFQISDQDLQKVVKGLEWLLYRQHMDGSWGASSEFDIDRLVTTCQVLTLLIELGYPLESKKVKKAIKFLLQEKFSKYEEKGPIVVYWRLEPFSKLLPYYPELKYVVDMDLKVVYERAIKGRGPSSHFVLPLYALKVLHILRIEDQRFQPELLVEKALDQWEGDEKCFVDRAHMTSLGLTWLEQTNWPDNLRDKKAAILRACEEYIIKKATRTNSEASWRNGYIATTSFVIINISEAASKKPHLHELVKAARTYLLKKQRKAGFWEPVEGERPPQITSNDYYTAVALRGIIASYKIEGQNVAPLIWSRIAEKHRRLERISIMTSAILGVIFVLYFGNRLVSSLPEIQSIYDVIMFVFGVLGVYPILESLIKKISKKLRG